MSLICIELYIMGKNEILRKHIYTYTYIKNNNNKNNNTMNKILLLYTDDDDDDLVIIIISLTSPCSSSIFFIKTLNVVLLFWTLTKTTCGAL